MLSTLPCPANQVSVHPPMSQTRIGAVALTIRDGVRCLSTPLILPEEWEEMLVSVQVGKRSIPRVSVSLRYAETTVRKIQTEWSRADSKPPSLRPRFIRQ